MVKSYTTVKICFVGKGAAGETGVVSAVLMNRTPCRLVHQYQRDGRACCLRLQSSSRELRNVGDYKMFTTLHSAISQRLELPGEPSFLLKWTCGFGHCDR